REARSRRAGHPLDADAASRFLERRLPNRGRERAEIRPDDAARRAGGGVLVEERALDLRELAVKLERGPEARAFAALFR
ncbi:MAG: hypothetical protein M3304_11850, partial [Actinomycetota bacterium]|nr:hypothetical protein [Actinomycetota bacterium]